MTRRSPFPRSTALAALAAALLAPLARGDELVLAGGSVVRGPILKESNDAVFVDLGFTVLSVPRASILQRLSDADRRRDAQGALQQGGAARDHGEGGGRALRRGRRPDQEPERPGVGVHRA